jgi:hypothetical protein
LPPKIAGGILHPTDPSKFILNATVLDPSFTGSTVDLSLPSGNKTLNRVASGSSDFSLEVASNALTTSDYNALGGANLDITVGGATESAQVQQNRIVPALGGRVIVGPAEVIIEANNLSQAATLSILPEPSSGQAQRDAALTEQGLKNLGDGREIQINTQGTLTQATIILPYDPALLEEGYDPSQARLAYFNPQSHAWEVQASPAILANNRLSVQVTHFSLYKPVLLAADTAPVLKEVFVYPNPATSPKHPTIRAKLGEVDSVQITIYDISGTVIHSHALSGRPTGIHGNEFYYDYTWSGEKPSGVYFAVIHGKTVDKTVRGKVTFAVVR